MLFRSVYGPNNWSTSVIGTTPAYLDARSWQVSSGNAFTDSDVRSATRVALIGKTAAENLFGDEDPVGKTFRIRQSPFIILGTLAVKGQGMDGRDQDDTILIPLTTAQRQVYGSQFPGSVRMVMVQTWRAVSPPPQDMQLALCDRRTFDEADVVPRTGLLPPDNNLSFAHCDEVRHPITDDMLLVTVARLDTWQNYVLPCGFEGKKWEAKES